MIIVRFFWEFAKDQNNMFRYKLNNFITKCHHLASSKILKNTISKLFILEIISQMSSPGAAGKTSTTPSGSIFSHLLPPVGY